MHVIGSNPLIYQVHTNMLDKLLSRIDRENLSFVISSKINEYLALGAPSQAQIAEQLGMSLRNLQRRLQEQGTCFKEILESTRKKAALEYIKQPHLSLSEVGYLVGFSSVANFNRAFKRWQNCTPGEYRSQYLCTSYQPVLELHEMKLASSG